MEAYGTYSFVSGFFDSAGLGGSCACPCPCLSAVKNFPERDCHNWPTRSPLATHLGFSPFLAVMNDAVKGPITSLFFVDE